MTAVVIKVHRSEKGEKGNFSIDQRSDKLTLIYKWSGDYAKESKAPFQTLLTLVLKYTATVAVKLYIMVLYGPRTMRLLRFALHANHHSTCLLMSLL